MPDWIVFPPGTRFRYRDSSLFVSSGRGIHRARTLDYYDLILVEHGLLGILEGERRYEVRPGEVLILSPGIPHAGTRAYAADPSFYWLEFYAERDSSGVGTGYPISVPRYGYAARRDRLTEVLRWIQDDADTGALLDEQFQSLAILLFSELVRSTVRPHMVVERSKLRSAKRAEQYILTHFRERLSVSVVAGQLGCNPDYLGRCVRAATGFTVTDLIHKLRTEHARFLLQQFDASVEQIADACGYGDARYFRKVFHRHTGLSPSDYRSLNGRVNLNTQVAGEVAVQNRQWRAHLPDHAGSAEADAN